MRASAATTSSMNYVTRAPAMTVFISFVMTTLDWMS
jgi:hypothetical protein